jgi:outer membrane protein
MSRAGVAWLLVLALPPGAVGTAGAVEGSDEAPRSTRLGVVDLSRVLDESLLGKDYARRVETLRQQVLSEGARMRAALERKDEEIRKTEEQFAAEQTESDEASLAERQQRAVRLAREREALRQDSEHELASLQRKAQHEADRLMAELRTRIQPFIDAVMKERDLDLVLDRNVCVAVSPAADVTEAVIRHADEAQRAAGDATAPAASTEAAGTKGR